MVWEAGRLAFERLQDRLKRRDAGASRLAAQWPAHFVVFDLLRLAGRETTAWPYRRRRAALEELFTERRLVAPRALCPSTTDPDTVTEWLTWTAVGLEGLLFKRLDSPYQPSMRGWRKYKVRETQDAIVGAVTGPLTAPRTLQLGRLDADGRLQSPAASGHPWTGWTFSAGWGSRETLNITLVEPELEGPTEEWARHKRRPTSRTTRRSTGLDHS
ncbi:hypothetical protein AB0N14_39390 [Streptomyces sp. NPDC051104]|uniref:ATP-dependent DNA ligase n=1 Tax=Streptomyces sp. NPDC051104 TaxID=3155044 RepID=UPI00341A5F83